MLNGSDAFILRAILDDADNLKDIKVLLKQINLEAYLQNRLKMYELDLITSEEFNEAADYYNSQKKNI